MWTSSIQLAAPVIILTMRVITTGGRELRERIKVMILPLATVLTTMMEVAIVLECL